MLLLVVSGLLFASLENKIENSIRKNNQSTISIFAVKLLKYSLSSVIMNSRFSDR